MRNNVWLRCQKNTPPSHGCGAHTTLPCARIVCGHTHRRAHNRVHLWCTAVCPPLCVHMGCGQNRAHSLVLLLPLLLLMLCCLMLHCTPQMFTSAFTTAGPGVPLRFQTNKAGQSKALLTSKKQEASLAMPGPRVLTRADSRGCLRNIIQEAGQHDIG
jgi:hypothetical protein